LTRFKVRGRGPKIVPNVLNAVGESSSDYTVGRRSLAEENGDFASCSRVPGDVVRRASRHETIKSWSIDGVS